MTSTTPIALALAALLSAGVATLSGQERRSNAFRFENTPENLQAFMTLIYRKLHVEKSVEEAGELFTSLVPNRARLKRALRDEVPAEVSDRIVTFFAPFAKATPADVMKIAAADQSVVRVRGATTEQIIEAREGTVAYEEFPGGAREIAPKILRLGTTFYQVEFRPPGKEQGITYHLFYWDGERWAMLGPAWRALR